MAVIKINYPTIEIKSEFKDIAGGEFFEYDNNIYIKLKFANSLKCNAVNISNGYLHNFSATTPIKILKEPTLTFKY